MSIWSHNHQLPQLEHHYKDAKSDFRRCATIVVYCNWTDLCSSPADPLKRHKEPRASPPCRREQSIRKEKQNFSQERQCNFRQAQNWGRVRFWSPTCLWCWRIPLLTLHLWLARSGQKFLPKTIEHHEFASLSASSDSKIFWFEIVCVWRAAPASADHPIWPKTQWSAPWSSFSCRFPRQPPPCLGLDLGSVHVSISSFCLSYKRVKQCLTFVWNFSTFCNK